jgi:hypothetical protein
MRIALLILAPLVASGQLTLFTSDGTNETAVGGIYDFGPVASGSTSSVRFRVRNTGNSVVTVTPVVNNGQPSFFSIASISGANPCTGPNALVCVEFTIAFQAPAQTQTNSYSAPLQVASPSANPINVLLVATAAPAPTLTGFPPGCSANGTTGIAFANVNIGSQGLCNFSLLNANTVPIVISTLTVTGDAAFRGPQNVQTPLTLAPNQAATFTLQFQPRCGTVSYAGTLAIDSRTYSLSGTGITPSLPTPAFHFDASSFSSMEQHTLTLTLPSAAVCGGSGNVNLAFTPSVNVPDDSTIVFVTRTSRSLGFTVKAGSTQVSIDSQASAVFATGSTAGTISFTVTGAQPAVAGSAPAASFNIAPKAIVIDTATASNQRLGELEVTVIGYDNTFSIGKMSFTFFDASGNTIGTPIAADFTSNFQSFFAGQQIGSTFLMRVSFPVTGTQTQVAKVQATLTNNAGQVQTGSLTFQ